MAERSQDAFLAKSRMGRGQRDAFARRCLHPALCAAGGGRRRALFDGSTARRRDAGCFRTGQRGGTQKRWDIMPWRGWRAPIRHVLWRWRSISGGADWRRRKFLPPIMPRVSSSWKISANTLFADVLNKDEPEDTLYRSAVEVAGETAMPSRRRRSWRTACRFMRMTRRHCWPRTDLLTEWFLPLALNRARHRGRADGASRFVARRSDAAGGACAGASRLSCPEPDVDAAAPGPLAGWD